MKSHASITSDNTSSAKKTVLVSGFARSFISSEPIADATITILENNKIFNTDANGKFGPFLWGVGQPITLTLEKQGSFWSGYRTTQTATLIVPPQGINDVNFLNNISFQVPSNIAFKMLSCAMKVTEDKDACQIAATITPSNMTMDDIPQGEPDVEAILTPNPTKIKPFYFGMFPNHKTNPFDHSLKATSLDGGVAFINVPEGRYTLTAKKGDRIFTEVTIEARKGVIVNASPPHGPTMLQESNRNIPQKSNHFQFFKRAVVTVGVGTLGLATCGVGGALAGAAVGYMGTHAVETLSECCSKSKNH